MARAEPFADTEPVDEAEPTDEGGPVTQAPPFTDGPPVTEAPPFTDAAPVSEAAAEPAESPVSPAGSGTASRQDALPLPIEDGAGELPPIAQLPAAELRAAIEAILLVVDEPVTEGVLADALEQPAERVGEQLSALAEEYEGQERGFELRRAAGGWRLYTRTRYAPYVERFVLDGQSVRLTQAALETLAVVAYKQPVTRSRISAIRGVNCDGVMRTLVTRGLIEDCGAEPETGAHLYRTTSLFLEKLGLDSVDQLPPLAPFLPDDVDEIADAQR
ncbi:SMC-Scp complex subunit ScpB [Rugosimonospora africana]|uniref:SMC-Scp complex subunit ScpB n=1 Tax=Rugosimonospora africana TaxID=556532 RepID=UPI0035716C8C